MLESKELEDLKMQMDTTEELKNRSLKNRKISLNDPNLHQSEINSFKSKFEPSFPIPENKPCHEALKKLVSHQSQQNSPTEILNFEQKEIRNNIRSVLSMERKLRPNRSDPSPIVFKSKDSDGINIPNMTKKKKNQLKFDTLTSNLKLSSEIKSESPNTKESNEGNLIKKLGEKQRMIDKYENMLKKVNTEFQNTLTINKGLNDEISLLELKLRKSEDKLLEVDNKVETNVILLQRQLDEMILEKDELQNDNIALNKLIKNKNFEIDEFRKIKYELENKMMSSNEMFNQTQDIIKIRNFLLYIK